MSLEVWGLFLVAAIVLSVTPGPNSLLAISNGMRYGVKRTFFSTLGCVIGIGLMMGLSLSGLGLILAASEAVFITIKWIGALYLIYLGWMLFRTKSGISSIQKKPLKPKSNIQLFLQGFVIIATNPKVLLFFTAFLPQFIDHTLSFWHQFIILASTFIVIEFVFEMFLATLSHRIVAYSQGGHRLSWFNKITGSAFMLAGAYLLTLEKHT